LSKQQPRPHLLPSTMPPKRGMRKRRNSLPQVEIKPDAEAAVAAVNSQQPSPTEPTLLATPAPPPLKDITQQDLARLYSPAALLDRGAWIQPVRTSHSQARTAELDVELKAVDAQQALARHQLAMLRRRSAEMIQEHVTQFSVRLVTSSPTETELVATLEALAKQRVAIETEALSLNDVKIGAQVAPWRVQDSVSSFLQNIAANNLKEVQDMLENGFEVTSRDSRGWTPLHQSCYMGDEHLTITKLLLSRGAEVEAINKEGHTPLELAQRFCNVKTEHLINARGTGRAPETLLSPNAVLSPPLGDRGGPRI